MIVNFKCPNCGFKELDEVMTNITQYSRIAHISHKNDINDVVINYGDNAYDGGDVDCYRCSRCCWTVPGMEDLNGCGGDSAGLYKWLEEQDMLWCE